MKHVLNKNVLVLNMHWIPINVTIVKEAISLIYKGHAEFVVHDNFKSKFNGDLVASMYQVLDYSKWIRVSEIASDDLIKLRSARYEHVCPSVIICKHDKIPTYYIRLSKRGVYNRDHATCQYCGIAVDANEFTIDHIIPKSAGGKTSWDNIVTCCKHCNSYKGSKPLTKSGLKLITKPVKPSASNFFSIYDSEYKKNWGNFIDRRQS